MKTISSLFADTPIVHSGATAGENGPPPLICTPARQWAYAAEFKREPTGIESAAVIVVRVRLEVGAGSVGVGCLDVEGTAFIDERIIHATDRPVDVELLAGRPQETGALIVRNASATGASQARVLEIHCLETDLADDSFEPRHPPLSEPPVIPQWNRVYGNVDLTPHQRLRARTFDAGRAGRVLTWTDGTMFELIDGDQLSRALFVSGTYEPNTLTVLRRLLRDGDVFIDVGANAGVVSVAASRWVGKGVVFSLEPSSREFRRLTANIERNHISNIRACRLAVSSQAGTLNLHVAGDEHGGLNTLGCTFPYEGVETLRTERVPSITLDEFVQANHLQDVAAIKLDIEGSEGAALTGAGHVLSDMRPALIIEVFSRALHAQRWQRSELGRLLDDAGYAAFSIDETRGWLVPQPSDFEAVDEQNVVALPHERASLLLSTINAGIA